MVTREQILAIAKLANLTLTEEQTVAFQSQLSKVFDYFTILNSIDVSNEPVTTHYPMIERNRFQEEKHAELSQESALQNASEKVKGYFATKAVL